jgi:ethanolamine ammonia-lyase small subunit
MSKLQPRPEADDELVIENPWAALRRFTAARIALGRTGVSQPTAPQLAFQLAHARARDAVHQALDVAPLLDGLQELTGQSALALHSAAASRDIYLQRPDLGRRLDDASRAALQQQQKSPPAGGYDLAFVIADGLSALAIEQNVLPFLRCLTARLVLEQWTLAPPAVVLQGRVAVGDEVGQLLGARAVLVLVGERPGLSSPDSMGLYLTWAPRVGLTDASRNCISNVRPAGLTWEAAAFKLHYLLSEARRRQLSGVALKDETSDDDPALASSRRNFLLD